MAAARLIAHVVVCLLASTAAQDDQGPQEVEVIKQINRMNEDGSYTFGYEAADGSFKIETRDVAGNVKGMFGFIDETGELKRVSYTANNGTGFKASGGLTVPTAGYTTVSSNTDLPGEPTRRPVLVLREPVDSSSRAPVIQHIPRRFGSTTTPSYGDYLKARRPHVDLPSISPRVTEEAETDEPTHIPLRKLVVTKRPVDKGGNHLRRQLVNEPESGGDVADVYSGGGGNPRFIPVQSVRSPQSTLLANLPPHVATAIRQQQIARATASLRPGPAVLDEQEYPVAPTRSPVRAIYRPVQEPPGAAFPMDSLRSLRDEIMDYILQYIQYRLAGGSPYMGNPFTPFNNPGLGYQNPIGYPGANPYNPYLYPGPPNPRGPYPPFPGGYPPVGYPGYPGQSFPQPLPFSSPNKQLAQQYGGQTQRSAAYEQSRGPTAQQYQEVDSRGSADQATYTLPPADVLRMMLARGLVTTTPSPTTRTPSAVRSVQILGAASSVSATSVRPPPVQSMGVASSRPPPAPRDEMEMQA